MAEGKKSFIIYTSWKAWLDGLTNEQKGMWLEWTLNYTNDNNPEYPQDQAVKVCCMMAQDTLKRDLKKYQDRLERIKQNGKQYRTDTEKNTTEVAPMSERSQTEVGGVNVNDNVNVNVNENVNDKSLLDNKASAKAKPTKHKYGLYQHVLLTNEEYDKLHEQFGNKTTDLIKQLDEGIELKGYKYKSHYLAILKWNKADDTKSNVKTNEYAKEFKNNLKNEMEEL